MPAEPRIQGQTRRIIEHTLIRSEVCTLACIPLILVFPPEDIHEKRVTIEKRREDAYIPVVVHTSIIHLYHCFVFNATFLCLMLPFSQDRFLREQSQTEENYSTD